MTDKVKRAGIGLAELIFGQEQVSGHYRAIQVDDQGRLVLPAGSFGDMFKSVYDPNNDNLIDVTGRSVTLTVAASNASALEKAQADYVCDGVADDVEIQDAIAALPPTVGTVGGGTIVLSTGAFSITSTILVNKANVTIKGQNWNTTLNLDANCHMFQIIGNGYIYPRFFDLVMDGKTRAYHAIYAAADRQVADLYIQRNLFTHFHDNAIHLECGGWHHTITENTIELGIGHAIYEKPTAYNSNTIIIAHNDIKANTGGYAVYLDGISTTYHFEDVVVVNNIFGGGLTASKTNGIYLKQVRKSNIVGNVIRASGAHGIALISCTQDNVLGNMITDSQFHGIYVDVNCGYIKVIGNDVSRSSLGSDGTYNEIMVDGDECIITSNFTITVGASPEASYGIDISTGAANNTVENNRCYVQGSRGGVRNTSTSTLIRNNLGFLAPGEVRSSTGSLVKTGTKLTNTTGVLTESGVYLKPGVNTLNITSAGTFTFTLPAGTTGVVANGTATLTISPQTITNGLVINSGVTTGTITVTLTCIAFAWHNPEAQDILVKKVVVYVTTPGGTATSELEVGIADDAVGTNRGTEFFNTVDLNAAAVLDSVIAPGTQTVWVFGQDSASATDGYIVGQILTEKADALIGSYYVEYVGK